MTSTGNTKCAAAVNITTMITVLAGLVIGGIVAADLYNIVLDSAKQSKTNGVYVNKTLDKLNKTYDLLLSNQHLIIDVTNQTNTVTNQNNLLIKFLTDNFGSDSGYLGKENFQYLQANQTFKMIEQILNKTK